MLYLASKSPRRQALLSQLGMEFELVEGSVVETPYADELPEDYVTRLARDKSAAGQKNVAADDIVIGSDTIVVVDQRILEKPKDFDDLQTMFARTSGRVHQVLTAVAVRQGQALEQVLVSSDVYFRSVSALEVQSYWQTGEPQDKAGGYAIQGIGGKFVTRIDGSYSAIVGLPLYETEQLLNRFIK
ncbi:septum formation inhibitor Maf [Thalassotalea litorea]|uniref:dTTP/UTP pyrophosphatase n=1 Tax=Thalassotalea litorea TaxID=2020715 RepID=A0A5R9IXL3_9GAMM|nr:Maf family protein [Thalassotalea litorea]TLU66668.1 septum formation inhibitor Maf [Thalassotalea litorea]